MSYKTPRVVWVSYTHLVLALDLWRFMGVVGIDLECEQERTTLVHTSRKMRTCELEDLKRNIRTLIGRNSEGEVEEIGGIWEVGRHR